MGLQSKRSRKKFKFQSIFTIIWCECDSLLVVEKKKGQVINHNLPHKINVKMSVELLVILKLLKETCIS